MTGRLLRVALGAVVTPDDILKLANKASGQLVQAGDDVQIGVALLPTARYTLPHSVTEHVPQIVVVAVLQVILA